MSDRKIKLRESGHVAPCPECENDTCFTMRSRQIAEDYCNTWVECDCGFDPTEENPAERYEDVWGGCSEQNANIALSIWNELLDFKKAS